MVFLELVGDIPCMVAVELGGPALYFELAQDWATRGGWHTKPAHHITWNDLDSRTAGDRRIDDVRAWSNTLTATDAWRDRYRPFELHPDPDTWHPSYIAGDHGRPRWAERQAAWTLAIAIYREAAGQLT